MLAVTGCGNGDSGNGDTANLPAPPTADDIALVDQISVTGEVGSQPDVIFPAPLSVTSATTRLVSPGTGDPILPGQEVSVDAATWRGDTGDLWFSTWRDSGPESFIMGSSQFIVLSDALEGANVGARVLVANPTLVDGQQLTVVSLFEVVDAVTIPSRAEGEEIESDPSLPVITLAGNGEPSIEFPSDFEPGDELIVQTLIQGYGPLVQADSLLTVQYTGWLTDGTVFDSSWQRDPAIFPLPNVIEGWREGLEGINVGSQVLLVIPPSLGYGDQDRGSIPANSTLIFVIDILRAQ
jgi:peptidylprolyl isomerase